MQEIEDIQGRLEVAPSAADTPVDTLVVALDAFGVLLDCCSYGQDLSVELFPAFTFAAMAAAEGRHVVLTAPSLPAQGLVTSGERCVRGDVEDIADGLADLAGVLMTATFGDMAAAADQHLDAAIMIGAIAGTALAAGRDLLHGHRVTDVHGTRRDHSDWAPVVSSAAVARAMMEAVARWSLKLTQLADTLAIACAVNDARSVTEHVMGSRNWLLSAGLAAGKARRGNPATAADTALLMSIPLNEVPDRRPPEPPEALADLAAGIEVSATRLRGVVAQTEGQAAWSPAATTDSWKWSATAAAVVFHLSGHLLRPITEGDSRWECPPEIGQLLRAAAEESAAASLRWRDVASTWGDLCTETRGRTAPGMADLSDLVLRVGRLAYTDPGWSPSQGRRSAQLRDPADLVPNAGRASILVGALRHASVALARLATATLHDVDAARAAGRFYVPTRALSARYDITYPYWHAPPGPVEAVLSGYKKAGQATTEAAAALGEAALSFGVACPAIPPPMSTADPAPDADVNRTATVPAGDPSTIQAADITALSSATRRAAGPVERALRDLASADPILLLRAKVIDEAGERLLAEVRNEARADRGDNQVHAESAAARAAESFPDRLGPRYSASQVIGSIGTRPSPPTPNPPSRSRTRRS